MVLSDSVWKHIPSSGASTFARRGRARVIRYCFACARADGPDVTVALSSLSWRRGRIGSSGEEVARLRARRPLGVEGGARRLRRCARTAQAGHGRWWFAARHKPPWACEARARRFLTSSA